MNTTRLALASVIMLCALGCSTSTEPKGTLILSITAAPVIGHTVLQNGASAYACDFQLVLTTVGGAPGDAANSLNGTINLHLNSNGQNYSAPTSSYTQLFGQSRVGVGERLTGTLGYSWSGPFTGSLITNYNVDNSNLIEANRSTTTLLNCQ